MGVHHFTELECWQLSRSLKKRLFAVCKREVLRADLKYVTQLREAARSPCRNIAEGFGKRTHAEFARFLDVARGSLMECQNHLHDGLDEDYISEAEFNELMSLAKRAGGAVAALQRYLRSHPDR